VAQERATGSVAPRKKAGGCTSASCKQIKEQSVALKFWRGRLDRLTESDYLYSHGQTESDQSDRGGDRQHVVGQPGCGLSALWPQGCHCASGAKHGPVFYLTRSEGGRTRNIYVPPELRAEVEAGVAAYRRYRELGQEMAEANARRLGLGQKRGRRE
jgi:hypothetical protein